MSTGSLSINNLTVTSLVDGKVRVLVDDVSLTVQRGRILALVGASGSGKSLTCAATLGVTPPGVSCAHGRAIIDEQGYRPEELRGRHVATIMQNPRSAFNPVRTMKDHAFETLQALGKNDANSGRRIADCMRAVGLNNADDILVQHAFEMSGGMLQRMMMALALLSEAPFLFADEPTTDLDFVVQKRVLELLERLVRERDLGVLLVTHDMGVVARLADDVAVIDHGRIVEKASVIDVFERPKHEVTRMLVASHLSLYDIELKA